MASVLLSDKVAIFYVLFASVVDWNDNTLSIYSQNLPFQTYFNKIKKQHH